MPSFPRRASWPSRISTSNFYKTFHCSFVQNLGNQALKRSQTAASSITPTAIGQGQTHRRHDADENQPRRKQPRTNLSIAQPQSPCLRVHGSAEKRERSQLVGRQGDVNVELHAPIVCSFSNVFGEHFSSLFEGLCNTYFTFLFSSKTVADKQFLQNT